MRCRASRDRRSRRQGSAAIMRKRAGQFMKKSEEPSIALGPYSNTLRHPRARSCCSSLLSRNANSTAIQTALAYIDTARTAWTTLTLHGGLLLATIYTVSDQRPTPFQVIHESALQAQAQQRMCLSCLSAGHTLPTSYCKRMSAGLFIYENLICIKAQLTS